MVANINRETKKEVASRVLERMQELIALMQKAAAEVEAGTALQEVETGSYQLYIASNWKGHDDALVCALDLEDCFEIIYSSALETGIRLEEMTELDVDIPKPEFGENMVTGGFEDFKGISVELRSDPLDELLDEICRRLKARGLTMICEAEEMILSLPLRQRA
jgi:hypothetical protein